MAWKYTKTVLEQYAPQALSNRQLITLITGNERPSGGSQNLVSKLLREYEIDTSHFTGQRHRAGGNYKRPPEYFFKVLESGSARTDGKYLRRALLESGTEEICVCGQGSIWNEQPLTLHVDHIDGNYLNNVSENLRFLCPNCHTQTATWGRKTRHAPVV